MSRPEKRILLIVSCIIIGVSSTMLYLDFITIAETLNILMVSFLVLITAIYAQRTADIADATKEQTEATKQQANASVKMAMETKEQRYCESLPLLVPTIPSMVDPITNIPNHDPIEVDYDRVQVGIQATLHNLGTGIAINVRVSFWKVQFFASRKLKALGTGEEKEIDFIEPLIIQLQDTPQAYCPRLEVEYQDIYERKITTVQEFRIEEQNNTKRAFLGDLYFTVNGKRLGEELTEHDS